MSQTGIVIGKPQVSGRMEVREGAVVLGWVRKRALGSRFVYDVGRGEIVLCSVARKGMAGAELKAEIARQMGVASEARPVL